MPPQPNEKEEITSPTKRETTPNATQGLELSQAELDFNYEAWVDANLPKLETTFSSPDCLSPLNDETDDNPNQQEDATKKEQRKAAKEKAIM